MYKVPAVKNGYPGIIGESGIDHEIILPLTAYAGIGEESRKDGVEVFPL